MGWTHSVSFDAGAGDTPVSVVGHSSDLALERAETGAWNSDPAVNATTTRALIWRCLFLLGQLQLKPANADGTPAPGDPAAPADRYPDADHAAMGRALVDPIAFLGVLRWAGRTPPADALASFHTADGDDATADAPGGEAGALPLAVVGLLVVGAVVGLGVLTAGLCYLGQRAPDVIDRELARQSATQAQTAAMMSSHAAAVRLVEAHLSAEADAGHALPLDDAERAVLATLTGNMVALGQAIAKPAPEVPLPKADPIPNPLPSGTGILAAATTIGLVAVVGWLALQYFERRS